jgi:hypothetical protein
VQPLRDTPRLLDWASLAAGGVQRWMYFRKERAERRNTALSVQRTCRKRRQNAQGAGRQQVGAAWRRVIPCFCAEPVKGHQKQQFGRLASEMTQGHDSGVDASGCSSKGTLDEMSENLLGIIFLWVKVQACVAMTRGACILIRISHAKAVPPHASHHNVI